MTLGNTLHYTIPVHNESLVLENTVFLLSARLKYFKKYSITLVENGSSDNSWEICKKIKSQNANVNIIQIQEKGLGFALRAGFEYLLKVANDSDYISFVGCDFPFQFSDMDNILKIPLDGTSLPVFVGSKNHHSSQLDNSFARKFLSYGFYLVRKTLLKMQTKDPQGTLFIPSIHLKMSLEKVKSNDFFFTTELVYMLEKSNVEIIEVPIVMKTLIYRPSSVSFLKDSAKLFISCLQLKFRQN